MSYRNNNRGRTDHSGQRRSQPSPTVAAVDVTFYADPAKRQLSSTLLDADAEKQALAFPEGRNRLTKSQIRRFFSEIKNLSMRLKRGRPWKELEPLFRMVKSKALYASGRSKVPQEFKDFIVANVDKVKSKEDFMAFEKYFEAVLGFAYGHRRVGDN